MVHACECCMMPSTLYCSLAVRFFSCIYDNPSRHRSRRLCFNAALSDRPKQRVKGKSVVNFFHHGFAFDSPYYATLRSYRMRPSLRIDFIRFLANSRAIPVFFFSILLLLLFPRLLLQPFPKADPASRHRIFHPTSLAPHATAILPDKTTHPATIRAHSGKKATPRRPLIADFEFPNTPSRVAFSGRRQLIWLRR